MKIPFFIFFSFLFISSNTLSQDVEKKATMLKIIKLNFIYDLFGKSNNDILRFAPNFTLGTKRKNRHEFELNKLSIRKYDTFDSNSFIRLGQLKEINLNLRYQFDFFLIKNNSSLLPFIGFSLLQSINKNRFSPFSHISSFDVKNFNYSANLGIVPGASVSLRKNLTLDISCLIDFLQYSFHTTKVLNPYVPSGSQGWSAELKSILGKNYYIFAGIGIKI